MNTPAHDPHSPRQVREMAGAADWLRLVALLTRDDPPNVLLTGQAGIGKSLAVSLALSNSIVQWFRCSQDPSLRDSRDRIKGAAKRRAEIGHVNWIVLEHADMLHADAQAFLRRVMETSVGSTRFLLEVRDASAVTEPLISRTVLFNAPLLMEYEIRAEILRRCPGLSVAVAGRFAGEANGNIRWAVLQGLGNMGAEISTTGLVDPTLPSPASIHNWQSLLATLEQVKQTGSSLRSWVHYDNPVWERQGGACPLAITSALLAASLSA